MQPYWRSSTSNPVTVSGDGMTSPAENVKLRYEESRIHRTINTCLTSQFQNLRYTLARIVKESRIIEVPPLSGLEEVDFPVVGRLEAFYTDGLRTLLSTIKGVDSMWEKTLRYPKHVEKIELLKALGFFDQGPILVEGVSVRPRALTARLLERGLRRKDVGDILAMMVEVAGEKRRRGSVLKYCLLDRFDEKKKVSAMARTTAYTASIIAQKLAHGVVTQEGVVPPEMLGMDKALFNDILRQLGKRGVRVEQAA